MTVYDVGITLGRHNDNPMGQPKEVLLRRLRAGALALAALGYTVSGIDDHFTGTEAPNGALQFDEHFLGVRLRYEAILFGFTNQFVGVPGFDGEAWRGEAIAEFDAAVEGKLKAGGSVMTAIEMVLFEWKAALDATDGAGE